MLITLVRHGECLGQTQPECFHDIDSKLTGCGRAQARAAAERLSTEMVTHVLSSPLIRALETADAIASTCRVPKIFVWTELREGFSDSRLVGFSRNRMVEQFPRLVLPNDITSDGWMHGDPDLSAFWERCEKAIRRLVNEYSQNDHLVVVTHGGCGNYLLHVLLGMDYNSPRWFELANGSLTRIRVVPDPQGERPNWPLYPPIPVELHSLNDISHLA